MIYRREFFSTALAPLLRPGSADRTCIVLRLTGGPSHLDTWDLKPHAPSEIRGPHRPIRTNVPGIEISELFPRMARCAERYAIVRSVHHDAATHEAAVAAMLPPVHPRVVTIDMFHSVFDEPTWDIHGWKPFSPMSAYRDHVGPLFDNTFTALLETLRRRDLFDKTLVVAMGEFGRTPKINPDGGRDHWPHCFSILMAGGGVEGGQVYGSSDAIGADPRDNPVTPAMIAATIRQSLGIAQTSERVQFLPILKS